MPFKMVFPTKPCLMLLCITLTACATKPAPPVHEPQPPKDDNTTAELLTSDNFLLNSLLAQKEDWQGVPYRYGGLSPKGVDCSGFVYLTFLSQLNMQVPRTTAGLLKEGDPVARNELAVGDLVFFRLTRGNRHVGIYMGDGGFSACVRQQWRDAVFAGESVLESAVLAGETVGGAVVGAPVFTRTKVKFVGYGLHKFVSG